MMYTIPVVQVVLAGNTGLRVLGQNGVQNGVRNLVADFVRVTFCHRFGCKQVLVS